MPMKILTIQDISCVGQCSLTVALPILSACGIETCVLPSAVLSTHTGGFKGWTFRDLTEDMPRIAEHWQKEKIQFDALYTGYLGSARQIDCTIGIMQTCLAPNALRIVDPAMADNGKLYPGFNDAFAKKMAGLCGYADIILPNITEASFLTGTEYKADSYNETYILDLLKRLADLGCKKVVLTGVSYDPAKLGAAVYHAATGKLEYYFHERIPVSSHGTGDVYASAFCGAMMRGKSILDAARIAADFTVDSIRKTMDDASHWYGVKFEQAIPGLIKMLETV
ncbi:MAG: pyridoxamine kinase [Kiritimatiellia bacterium]